jgi:amidase
MRLQTLATAIVFATATAGAQQRAATPRADVVYEASITELQSAMTSGRLTSVGLVDAYLARIKAYDHAGPALNAMIRLNPRARSEAAALDAERRAGKVRGKLHGIPIILKDNYDTADLPTTAGSIALGDLRPKEDAFQVRKLREAGAVILGKANMHELASGITTIGSMGGQTCNPYDPDRNPGGSSGGSGAATAASFGAIAFGSDTCGSIRIPAASHNLFGLRPTKGLSSIAGIIPLSHTQDVAGPLARSVTDLAIALDATVGADPADTATRILEGRAPPSFVQALDSTSLKGARLGVLTAYLGDQPEDQEATRVVRAALDRMRTRGAEVVEVTIPALDSIATRAGVIDYEFKYDLADYLAKTPGAAVGSLSDIVRKGLYHSALEQTIRRRDSLGTRSGEAYASALRRRIEARDLVVKFLDERKLDALVYPTVRRKPATLGETQRGSNCQLSAVTGLPAVTIPAGFTPDGLPIGVELLGRALSDARLVAFAFDYEQAVHPRRAPPTTPALVDGRAPAPERFSATGTGNGATLRADLRYDHSRRTLAYTIRVSSVAAPRVVAVTLDRGSPDKKGAVLFRLSGPGSAEASGVIKVDAAARGDLLEGRTVVSLYTSDHPAGAVLARVTRVAGSGVVQAAGTP